MPTETKTAPRAGERVRVLRGEHIGAVGEVKSACVLSLYRVLLDGEERARVYVREEIAPIREAKTWAAR